MRLHVAAHFYPQPYSDSQKAPMVYTVKKFALSCRTLEVHEMSNEGSFVRLAGPQLQSFSSRPKPQLSHASLPDRRSIAAMTSLTRLELIDFGGEFDGVDVAQLQQLRLRELVLIDSPHMPQALIADDSLIALERLHIDEGGFPMEERSFYEDLCDPNAAGHERAQELHQLGSTVQGLPNLTQVSGHCSLFAFGMSDALLHWEKSEYVPGSLTKYGGDGSKYRWTRLL